MPGLVLSQTELLQERRVAATKAAAEEASARATAEKVGAAKVAEEASGSRCRPKSSDECGGRAVRHLRGHGTTALRRDPVAWLAVSAIFFNLCFLHRRGHFIEASINQALSLIFLSLLRPRINKSTSPVTSGPRSRTVHPETDPGNAGVLM